MRSANVKGAEELIRMKMRYEQAKVPLLVAPFTAADRQLVGKIQAYILGLEAPDIPTYKYPKLDPVHMVKLITQQLSLTDPRFKNITEEMCTRDHPWIRACTQRVKEVLEDE